MGIDSSPEVIAMCGNAFPDSEWHIEDVRTLALPRTFDGILAWNSFFHLTHDDQRIMFAVFMRHVALHATLMFTSRLRHGEAIGSSGGEPLCHASLDPSEYRQLLAANGFNVVAHLVEDTNCGGHTVWLAQLSDHHSNQVAKQPARKTQPVPERLVMARSGSKPNLCKVTTSGPSIGPPNVTL